MEDDVDSELHEIFEIIGFVYQYLELLRQNSPQEWIFKELQDIANVDFSYAEEQPQDDYAAKLTEAIRRPSSSPLGFLSNFYEKDDPSEKETKEQLGYVVDCSARVTYRIMGFCFRVQSSDYDPVYLEGRIDNFINGVEELLDGLDDKSFESYRSGLIAKLLEKDPSLAYETNRFWGQITDKRYMFDMSEKEAEELRSIQKSDLVECIDGAVNVLVNFHWSLKPDDQLRKEGLFMIVLWLNFVSYGMKKINKLSRVKEVILWD
ncbi:hypothetical protein RND71_005647 [Anisodus tanguticus]|uniref:Coenzyme PQQ synthesis protein F-like C-terminal lobe domain-containing protein n=1 Tax=Anisodus tanguticus TaxID=243964 RepID=A0AAE1SRW5_9SOLA|nr:hypothetical protein RND71_005647 [Anisodus tanguticus]